MASLCDAVVARGVSLWKTVSGKSPLRTNQVLFPPAPHSNRNGISSITLSHMEKIPRGLLSYNPVRRAKIQEEGLPSGEAVGLG